MSWRPHPLLLILVLSVAASIQMEATAFRYKTPEKTDSTLVRAKTLLSHEDIEEAAIEFRKLIQKEPQNFEGYLGIADCLYLQNEYSKASGFADKALKLNPKSAETFRRRGKINEKLNQLVRAVEDYTHAIALSPSNHLYLSDRADVYSKKGEYSKAIADLDKYLKLVKRPNPRTFYARSELYMKLGKKTEADAERKRGDMIIDGNY